MSEDLYDEKIAPVLAQLGALCKEHSLPFLAVVEYAPGEFGQTTTTTPEQSLPMTMANIAARCRGNLDSFTISLLRHCKERGIDTSASFVANRFAPPSV
jgi:hypothetical protein